MILRIAGSLIGLMLMLSAVAYVIYFWYRVAVTVHAWPFG